MSVSQLRCPNCIAPIDPSYGQVHRCPYCSTTLTIGGYAPAPAVGSGSSHRLVLEESGPNKIAIIKTIREHTGLGLKESKDLSESTPCVVAEWGDAERMKRFRDALIASGARVR